jgi:DNA repair protein RadC
LIESTLIMEKQGWQAKGDGHRQRLREKFLEGGLERFSDEEVIEFLLTLVTPRKDVKPQAREALKRFGSLSGVLSAPGNKLMEIKGIGPKNALYMNLVHQVAGRYLRDRARGREFFSLIPGRLRLSVSHDARSQTGGFQGPFSEPQE